ncbi:MAG TPA: TadE family protein [Azospira sp.]|nr:TadE family protein [Azospira sp.]
MSAKSPQMRSGKQRGVAVVEFALVLPVLLLVIAGLAEFGRVIWYYDALAKATRDGARSLSLVTRTDWSDNTARGAALTAAQTLVVNAAAAANLPALASSNVQVQCDSGSGFNNCSSTFPNYVRVAVVNYGVDLGDLFPLITVERNAWSVTTVSLRPVTAMPYMQ